MASKRKSSARGARRDSGGEWLLQSTAAAVRVGKADGCIHGMLIKRPGVDPFDHRPGGIPAYLGGLRVYDERDRRWYDDADDAGVVDQARLRGGRLRLRKRYRNAPFILQLTLELQGEWLSWEVEARKLSPRTADRSLRVHFRLPALAGWDVWAPCRGGRPFTFDGMTPFSFMYAQNSWVSESDVILPMMSHYHPGQDAGFSLMNGLDDQVPASRLEFANGDKSFFWGNYHKDTRYVPHLELVNYCIGLVGERPMRTRALVLFHPGHWRPALGRVYKRWQKIFDPDNRRIYDYEGVFECTSVAPRDLVAAKRERVQLLECHDHFPHYGQYHSKDKWYCNHVVEALWRALGGNKKRLIGRQEQRCGVSASEVLAWMEQHDDREIFERISPFIRPGNAPRGFPRDPTRWSDAQVDEYLYHTPERIRARLRDALAHGLNPFWYFNYSDGFRPLVEQKYPDAISRHEDGSATPSGWQMCHNMNPDPRYSFGRDLLRQARRIVEDYPEIKGFFLDCFRHYEIDFAHDDGVTVVNHKPAYSNCLSYHDIDRRLKTMLRKRGLCTFANKPQTIGIMRHVDGMMLEGSGDRFEEEYFWSGIAMPIIFLWTHTQSSTDEMYRRSIIYGCFPRRVHGEGRLLERYWPLCEQFRGRVLCFEPDPIRGPRGARVQLYTVGRDYLASVVNLDFDQGDRVRWGKTPHVVFRVKRAHDVGRVGIMCPGDKKWRLVKPSFNGTFLAVPLEGYSTCAIVKLFVTGNTRRRIGKKIFPRFIERCPDPVSAFEDLEQG